MLKKPILYMHILSPPSRSVLMTGAELGIEFTWKIVDLMNLEHKKPEYTKINPQQTIPVLDDNGVVISDSHAICAYLSDKYGQTDRLYPRDLAKRALINSRMHFNSGQLFPRMRFSIDPILNLKTSEVSKDRIEYVQQSYKILERYLAESKFVCGNEMTIADLCLITTTTSVNGIIPLDSDKHKNILQWIRRMSELTYYEKLNGKPVLKSQMVFKQLQDRILEMKSKL